MNGPSEQTQRSAAVTAAPVLSSPTLLPRWGRVASRAFQRIPAWCPGKARVARLALGKILSTTNVILKNVNGCRFVVPHLSEPIAFHLLVDAVYEPGTDAYLRSLLHPGDVFVDVGANIGVFAVMAGQIVGKTGRVVAIEASPSVFPYLLKNIELNAVASIDAMNYAASDQHRDTMFWEAPISKFGMGALVPQFCTTPRLVPCRRLDDMLQVAGIENVSVLKVDVEGAEVNVFRGALKLLRRSPGPIVIFELCDWAEARFPRRRPGDAQRLLIGLGYKIWRLKDFRQGGQPVREPLDQGFETLVAVKGSRHKIFTF